MHGGGRARRRGAPSKQTHSAPSQRWEMQPAYLDCPGAGPNIPSPRIAGRANGFEPLNGGLQTCVMKIAALRCWGGPPSLKRSVHRYKIAPKEGARRYCLGAPSNLPKTQLPSPEAVTF